MNTFQWKKAGLLMALVGAASLSPAAKRESAGSADERPTREEMRKRFDTDGDGQLSEQERAAMREEMDRRGGSPRGDKESKEGKGRKGARHEEMLRKYDRDGDGQLSEKERRKMQKDQQKRQRERQKQQDQA